MCVRVCVFCVCVFCVCVCVCECVCVCVCRCANIDVLKHFVTSWSVKSGELIKAIPNVIVVSRPDLFSIPTRVGDYSGVNINGCPLARRN